MLRYLLKFVVVSGFALVGLAAAIVSAQELPADFDYLRLAHPDVAEFLQLTDSQRTEMSRLLAERTDKLAAAAEDQRNSLATEYDQKLLGLLTPEQKERLSQLPELRKLRFNFGAQQDWGEMLRWFAKQADLSLVMGTPPRGAFNYADSNEYTPAQAINLLNSILLTKGFTLVRRDKLLILVEINDGIPDEILPKLSMAELDKRGSFEIVKVTFPLGDKPPDTVLAEIKPMLGSYGKIVLLPQSKQLIVTETVGKLKAMDLLIQSIPAAPAAPTPAQPVPPEPMVLESYPLGQLNFASTVESLKLVAPTAIVTGGEASQKFIVYGTASQQSLIKSLLEQLNSGAAPQDTLARLQIYTLEGAVDPKSLQEQIALLAPSAKIAVDATGKRLMVFAAESQQKLIADALIKLEVITQGEPGNQVQLFSLKRAKPTTAASMVLAISPKATATPDETSGTLLVRARNEEMEIIRQMIAQLEGQALPEENFAIKSYQIGSALPVDFTATLQALAPKAKIQFDSATKKLLVIGTPEDQHKLDVLITQYQTTRQADADAKLSTFVVTPAQKTQFLTILQSWPGELATAQVITDEAPDRLSLWASPRQVAEVNAILEQIKNDANLKIYPLLSADSATAITLIKSLVPQAQVTADAAASQLIVVATETAHASVKSVLEQLQQAPANPNQISAKFYPMDSRHSATAIAILTEIVPAAKVKWDSGTNQLSVVASERDQTRVAKALEEIKPFLVPSEKGTLVVYPISPDLRARFDAVLTTLTSELADVRVIDDKRPGELAVMAKPSQHALIREIIGQLSQPVEGAEPFTLTAYALNESDPKLTVEFLQQLFPAAKLTPDETSGRLLVWAQASTHQQIQKALEEFSRGQPTTRTNPQSLKSYKLINVKPSTVTTMLQQLVPKMQLVANDDQTMLLAWGRELDHQRLKAAVEQIGQPDDPKASSVKLYPTGKMDALICAAVISKVLPDAIVVPNAESSLLAVLARADQHKLVQQSLDQMSGFVTAGGPPSVTVYRVERSGSTAAIAAITPVVPRAKLLAGTNTQQMIAVANELDQAKIKETVDALESDLPDSTGLKLRVFHLRQDLAAQVKPLLIAAFPTLKFVGTDPSLIAVWASEEENQRIGTLIQESESQLVAAPKSIKSYELRNVTAAQAKLALQARLSQLAFVEMGDERALFVLASPEEHESVASILDELQSAVITRQSATVESFPLPGVPLDLLVSMLPNELASQATIKMDPATETLIVSATEAVHAALRPVITDLQAKLPKIDKPISQIYSLNGVSPKDWQTILTQLAPTATMATDTDSGSLVIVARPSVHATIKTLMDEFRNTVTIGKSARAYRVSKADVQTAADAITALVPNAKVSVDKSSRSLIVVANEQDQQSVADTIQQIDLNAPNAAVSAIYAVSSGDGTALATALKGLVPSATYVADATGKSLLVLATVEEQALIKKTVDQWSQDPSRALLPKVYPLSKADPAAAIIVLTKLLPGATLAADTNTRSIVATATAEQHGLIEAMVKELDSATDAVTSKIYPANGLTAKDWQALLAQMAPGATVAIDPDSGSLVVTARSQVHTTIQTLMDEFRNTVTIGKSARAYRVSKADVQTAADAITALVPNAKVSVDKTSRSLIVVANEQDQQSVADTIQQIDLNAPNAAVSAIYAVSSGDGTALATALKGLVPSATYVADATGKSLLVLATVEEQALIKKTVDQWSQDPSRALVPKVYPLSKADPAAAIIVLTKLLPGATLAADTNTRSIVATATAEQHGLIEAMVKELDSVTDAVTSKIYPANGLTAKDWQALLAQMAPGATVAIDPDSGSLVVTARSQVHTTIQTLMDEFRNTVTIGKSARAYRVSKADVQTAADAITALVPNAKVSVDKTSRSLIVVANEQDQQSVADTIQQIDLNAPNAAVSAIYAVSSGDGTALATALKGLVPSATYVADATGKSLLVLATVEEQALIKKTVDQWSQDPSRALLPKVYPLSKADPAAAIIVLTKLLPGATLAADTSTRSIVATATAEQHGLIEAMVKELDNVTDAVISKIYPSGGLAAKDWQALLAQLAPGASVAIDPDSQSLVVTARSQVHTSIAALIEEFRNAVTIGKSARAYRVSKADVQTAADAIMALVPNAKVSVDKTSRSLIVVANEQDQQSVADTIQQIDLNAPNAAISAVYAVSSGDGTALATALKGLVPSATYVADATGKSLLVLATVEEQALIKKTVDQWSQDPSRALLPKVYTLKNGEPQAAMTVLQKLLPGATFAVDASTRSVAATGTAEQHKLISQTVLELDGAGGDSGPPELRSYVVLQASVDSLALALQTLFKADAQVNIVADKTSNSLIAVARPHQHEMIKGLVSATEETAGTASSAETLVLYPLSNVDGKSFTDSLNKLFENSKPKPQISYDSGGQQVLAIASRKQHEQISAMISQMRPVSQDFELFHLRSIDLYTAQSAIDGLFRDEPRNSAPVINVDNENGTLLIRATPEQLVEIRALLIKLGETEITLAGDARNKKLMRVVPINADVDKVLEQLQTIWPKMRGNELRVIRPANEQPAPRPDQPAQVKDKSSSLFRLQPLELFGRSSYVSLLTMNRGSQDLPDGAKTPSQDDKPPILIILGNRQITLASSDSEALDQLEQVLRTILGPSGDGLNLGNFQTFSLRNAGAEQVASILKELFDKRSASLARSTLSSSPMSTPLLVAADERLNMIVIHANRADREIIGNLIQVLDSPDVTDALSINQAIIVTVRNTDADRILTILNSVFRTQLSSGGGRKQVPIPEGLPVELASLLQQVNVATSGPLLTLGVDTVTNSIIVLAPPQLRDQVKATITQLDNAVESEPGEQIEIIQLQKTSPARIQRALDNLFKTKK